MSDTSQGSASDARGALSSAPACREADRCDGFPAGDDKASSSGLCTVSHRQGFVTFQLKDGQTVELNPNESTPDAFFDG